MKVFVFVLLLGTALCVSYDTESGDKKPFVTNDDIGIKYHKAVNYVKENYKCKSLSHHAFSRLPRSRRLQVGECCRHRILISFRDGLQI